MSELKVTKRYVQGFIRVVHEARCVDEVERSLNSLDSLLREHDEVMHVLHHPGVSRQRKKSLLRACLAPSAPEQLKVFCDYIIDKKREKILPHLAAVFQHEADTLRGVLRANVRAGVELTEDKSQRLTAALEKMFGCTIRCEHEVDSGLRAGVQVFIDSYVIDASITGRLNRLRSRLSGEAADTAAAA